MSEAELVRRIAILEKLVERLQTIENQDILVAWNATAAEYALAGGAGVYTDDALTVSITLGRTRNVYCFAALRWRTGTSAIESFGMRFKIDGVTSAAMDWLGASANYRQNAAWAARFANVAAGAYTVRMQHARNALDAVNVGPRMLLVLAM